jgi:hypothetical protein
LVTFGARDAESQKESKEKQQVHTLVGKNEARRNRKEERRGRNIVVIRKLNSDVMATMISP